MKFDCDYFKFIIKVGLIKFVMHLLFIKQTIKLKINMLFNELIMQFFVIPFNFIQMKAYFKEYKSMFLICVYVSFRKSLKWHVMS